MNQNSFGEFELNENDLFNLIYQKDLNLNFIKVDKSLAEQFNRSKKANFDSFPYLKTIDTEQITIDEFDNRQQKKWLVSDLEFDDLLNWLHGKCQSQEEIQRVDQEWDLFVKHNMLDLLSFLKYLVDTMRQNSIVWGVGRGSSVASFILYLLGVHKINSIKYNLDIGEFLK